MFDAADIFRIRTRTNPFHGRGHPKTHNPAANSKVAPGLIMTLEVASRLWAKKEMLRREGEFKSSAPPPIMIMIQPRLGN